MHTCPKMHLMHSHGSLGPWEHMLRRGLMYLLLLIATYLIIKEETKLGKAKKSLLEMAPIQTESNTLKS